MPDVKLVSGVTVDVPTHTADLDAHTYNAIQKFMTGEYYCFPASHYANITMVADRLYASPLIIVRDMTVDRIAIQVSTAGAAGTKARLGIYNDGTNLYPGTLLLDAGEVAVDAVAIVNITISKALTKGIYWMAIVTNGTPDVMGDDAYDQSIPIMGLSSTNFGVNNDYWYVAHTYAALPTPYTAAGSKYNSGKVRVALRVLSLD